METISGHAGKIHRKYRSATPDYGAVKKAPKGIHFGLHVVSNEEFEVREQRFSGQKRNTLINLSR
jgi:hypothetical protein